MFTGSCLFLISQSKKNHALETILNVDDSISKTSAVLHQTAMIVVIKNPKNSVCFKVLNLLCDLVILSLYMKTILSELCMTFLLLEKETFHQMAQVLDNYLPSNKSKTTRKACRFFE